MPLIFNNCLFLCSLILANSSCTFIFSNCACKSASLILAKIVPACTTLPSGICKKTSRPLTSGRISTKSLASTEPFASTSFSTSWLATTAMSTEIGAFGLNLSVFLDSSLQLITVIINVIARI